MWRKNQAFYDTEDQYAGADCGRKRCALCLSKTIMGKWKPCWNRGVLYKATCFLCKEDNKISEYIGESSKSIPQRAKWHYNALKYFKSSSFLIRHMLTEHPDIIPTKAQFLWEQISKEPVAYIRQIKESILIKESNTISSKNPKHSILNSKFKYNRSILADL